MARGLLLFLLAGIAGCRCMEHRQKATAESSDRWLLRSYEVSGDDGVALLNQLRDLFIVSKGDNTYSQLARASMAPNGQLVVVGDAEIQAGVKELVDGMAGHKATAARSVATSYWLVTGRPAKAEPPLPDNLKPVAEALHEVTRQNGPQEFALWEELHLLSNGIQSRLEGRHASIRQDAVVGGDKVLLTTRISASRISDHMTGPNDIDTKIEVAPDQTVVLAQTGFNPSEPLNSASGNDPPVSLYYLVKASVRNGDSKQP
jgi:hypothetical protein